MNAGPPAPQRAAQRGFTLFELMVAVTVSVAVLAPAMALLFSTIAWSEQAGSQIRLNQQAREIHRLLADGARLSTAGADGTPSAYGLHGMTDAPPGSLRSGYRLQFTSNGLTVASEEFGAMAVACGGAATPLPDCASSAETKSVSGYLSQDVTLNVDDRSVDDRTAEISFTLTDPFQAQRLENPALATESYMAIFTLLEEQ